MSKLHRLLLGLALAMACIVLAAPMDAQMPVALDHLAVESTTLLTPPAMTELQDQKSVPQQALRDGSGDKHPASAAVADNASNNTSASGTGTKDKKNKKNDKAKPASSEEEEFNKVLLGIYG